MLCYANSRMTYTLTGPKIFSFKMSQSKFWFNRYLTCDLHLQWFLKVRLISKLFDFKTIGLQIQWIVNPFDCLFLKVCCKLHDAVEKREEKKKRKERKKKRLQLLILIYFLIINKVVKFFQSWVSPILLLKSNFAGKINHFFEFSSYTLQALPWKI